MEKEPPQQPPPEEEDAKIIPFKKPGSPELERAMFRHPASGRESPEETLGRLGMDLDDEDDDD